VKTRLDKQDITQGGASYVTAFEWAMFYYKLHCDETLYKMTCMQLVLVQTTSTITLSLPSRGVLMAEDAKCYAMRYVLYYTSATLLS
jgi:hypothetical protein